MKHKICTALFAIMFVTGLHAQVPYASSDVMLQAFYWNSHSKTKWNQLKAQSSDLSSYFDLIWLPPSAAAEGGGSSNVGYHPYQWSNQNSSWGTVSELKSLISSLKAGGAKVVADVVINHRAGDSWLTFPQDNYGPGYTTYQFESIHICGDDEAKNRPAGVDPGKQLSSNNDWNWNHSIDTWGGYAAARDLDHYTPYVRSAIKEYMRFLKNEIGYDGWRYDLVKGYCPDFTKEYNNAAGAYMSVGEYYDSNYDKLNAWVNATGKTSMVFDFAIHDQITKWGGGSNYGELAWWDGSTGKNRPAGYVHSPATRQYAVTFVDNHDTAESHHSNNWSYKGDIPKAYAFLLSAPGIPCVFYEHWDKNKNDIKKMIKARKEVGLHSDSDVEVQNTSGYYKAFSVGKCGMMLTYIGGNKSNWDVPTGGGWSLNCEGNGWAMYTNLGSNAPCKVTGSGNGNTGNNGNPIGTITVSFKAPSSWSEVYIWAWDEGNTSTNYTGGTWPGQKLTEKDENGYFTKTFTGIQASSLGVVYSNGAGDQTIDLSTSKNICWEATTASTIDGKQMYDASVGNCFNNGGTGGGEQGGTTTTITVRFKAPNSWTNVNIWAWDTTTGTNYTGDVWPGQKLTEKDANGYYVRTFTNVSATLGIVYNNGVTGGTGEEQTIDLTTSTNICWEATTATAKDGKQVYEAVAGNCENSGGTGGGGTTTSITVRFKAPNSWSNVSIWAWDKANTSTNYTGGTWPGQKLTEKDANGYYVKTFANVASTIGIVYSNGVTGGVGEEQTIDLETSKNICWEATSANSIDGKEIYNAVEGNCTMTNIDRIETEHIVLYPNPAETELTIFTNEAFISADIQTIAGQHVKSFTGKQVSVADLSAGLYLLHIRKADGSLQTIKFIKK